MGLVLVCLFWNFFVGLFLVRLVLVFTNVVVVLLYSELNCTGPCERQRSLEVSLGISKQVLYDNLAI